MQPLAFPVKLPMWQLASFKIDRPALRTRIGPPHIVETDGSRTHGGEEDCWAFVTPSGQRVVLTLRVPYQEAVIFADPPDVRAALEAFAGAIADSSVSILDRPYPET